MQPDARGASLFLATRNGEACGHLQTLVADDQLLLLNAWGINNSAQVVGYSSISDAQDFMQACFWERNDEGQWTLTPLSPNDRTVCVPRDQ